MDKQTEIRALVDKARTDLDIAMSGAGGGLRPNKILEFLVTNLESIGVDNVLMAAVEKAKRDMLGKRSLFVLNVLVQEIEAALAQA